VGLIFVNATSHTIRLLKMTKKKENCHVLPTALLMRGENQLLSLSGWRAGWVTIVLAFIINTECLAKVVDST
jgi:hypothetical protein